MPDISLEKFIEHIDKRFDSLQSDVNGIRQDFNTFEAGRLTDLTAKVAVLQEKQIGDDNNLIKTLTTKALEYVVLAVVGGLVYLLFNSGIMK